MSLFQILQKPSLSSDEIKDDDYVIIDEKFSWFAAFLPPLWLISKNLWLELVLWLSAIFVLGIISSFIGGEAVFWLYVLSAIYIGFEATNIYVRALKRKGLKASGDIIASDYEQAQVALINFRLGS
ncbi:MAG: DUF2628 domain-containing protein [Devosiaceae bacterium]|nr:DUF2628 domain-containing protein [Devosiaceae bacterium]